MRLKKYYIFTVLALLFVSFIFPKNAKADNKVNALYVNGINVLSCKNMNDVLGDGTVSFDESTDILTLKDATLTKGYTKESYVENPRIFYKGDLTILLIGKNKITCGTTNVMGQPLRDNAVFGEGKLTVTAEEKATLDIGGMISMPEYVQKSGTINVSLTNDHSKITKWGMYINRSISIEGGTLTVSSAGKNTDGAVCLDEDALNIASGAKLYEGDKTPGKSVSSFTIRKGLTCNTKNYIRVVLSETTPAKPSIKLKQDPDKKSITITISKTENAIGYYIYLKGPEDTKYTKVKTLKKDGSAKRSYTLKDLEPGTYSFKVRAYMKTDGKTVKGEYCKVKKIVLE